MLYLIRHGETEWNVLGRIQGRSDVPLSPRGEEQARQLAHWMRNLRLHRVIASDLARARQTAEVLVGDGGRVSTDERLRERSFGPFEGWTMPAIMVELRERFSPMPESFDPLEAWPSGSGVESLEDLLDRSVTVVAEHREDAATGNVALVTHGNVVHALLGYLLQLRGPRSVRLPNCCCIELEARKGRWMLRSMIAPDMLGGSAAG